MRHYSFTMSRPGLKPGHFVPLRLRIVDTVTVSMGIPMVVVILCVAMLSLKYAAALGLGIIWRNEFAFYGYLGIVMFVASWIVYFFHISLFRSIFLRLGMLSKDEAIYYPLKIYKGGKVDPWPENWQKPDIKFPYQ